MTALAARGMRVGVVRTAIEVVVLAVGWLLGGSGEARLALGDTAQPAIFQLVMFTAQGTEQRHADQHRAGEAAEYPAHAEQNGFHPGADIGVQAEARRAERPQPRTARQVRP